MTGHRVRAVSSCLCGRVEISPVPLIEVLEARDARGRKDKRHLLEASAVPCNFMCFVFQRLKTSAFAYDWRIQD